MYHFRGLIKAWHNLESDNSTLDVAKAETETTAGGGKIGGKPKRNIKAKANFMFDQSLPDIPETLVQKLPSSVGQVSFTDIMEASSIIDNVLSIFLVLRLMGICHVKSKPYYNEICQGVYPSMELDECTRMLFDSLQKYNDNTPADDSDFQRDSNHTQFTELLDIVEFEMITLSRNTIMGNILKVAACDVLDSDVHCIDLEKELRKGAYKIYKITNRLTTKRRMKHHWLRLLKPLLNKGTISRSFRNNHLAKDPKTQRFLNRQVERSTVLKNNFEDVSEHLHDHNHLNPYTGKIEKQGVYSHGRQIVRHAQWVNGQIREREFEADVETVQNPQGKVIHLNNEINIPAPPPPPPPPPPAAAVAAAAAAAAADPPKP